MISCLIPFIRFVINICANCGFRVITAGIGSDITIRLSASRALVLVAVHSLSASVSMSDFNFLKRILHVPQLRFEADSFEPLIVLSDKILDQRVLLDGLLLADWQLAHELVCELALTLSLAVLAEEQWVGVR